MNAKNLGKFHSESTREIQGKFQSVGEFSSEIQSSRREFVKNSGKVALAGVALGAMSSISPLLANANLAQNSAKTAQNSASQNTTNSLKGEKMTQNS